MERERDGEPVLLWSLGDQRFAVPLEVAVEVTPVAALTERTGEGAKLGHLDLRGASVPVFHAGRLLGAGERDVMPSDRFLILQAGRGRVALLVDRVDGIGSVRSEPTGAGTTDGRGSRLARVAGDVDLPLVTVIDLDTLITAAT